MCFLYVFVKKTGMRVLNLKGQRKFASNLKQAGFSGKNDGKDGV